MAFWQNTLFRRGLAQVSPHTFLYLLTDSWEHPIVTLNFEPPAFASTFYVFFCDKNISTYHTFSSGFSCINWCAVPLPKVYELGISNSFLIAYVCSCKLIS